MLYNRKLYTLDRLDYFTVLELIYSHFDYKKGYWSSTKYMEDSSDNARRHARRLYNLTQQIDDWSKREKIKGESEYIVTKFIREFYEKEVE